MNKILTVIIAVLSLNACAEQINPSGGKIDTIPPKALKLFPENFSTNFNSNKIEIKFDEFIKLNKSGGNIIISPSLEQKPKIELIGKKIKITFKEKLKNNTTYIINFGNSIKDINEGNELTNFKYIFSTGTFIDSLKITGTVFDAFNNKPVENIIVGLFPNNDETILINKPLYLIKTDKKGFYSIENIKAGNYKIAALEDKNLNYIYDQENERIAFKKEQIILQESIKNENLYLYKNIKNTKIKNYINEENNHVVFNLSKSFLNLDLNISTYDKKDIFYFTLEDNAFHYWYQNKDSVNTVFDFNLNEDSKDEFNVILKEDKQIENFKFELKASILPHNNLLVLNFPYPISSFDKNLLSLDNGKDPVTFSYVWKNKKQTLEVITNSKNDSLNINIKEACFTSFHNLPTSSHTETISKFNNDVSNLTLNIKENELLVIELYNSKNEIKEVKYVSRETKILFENIQHGKYFLRIYDDVNQDSSWNTGLLKKLIQPEKTLLYKEIEIKENWDEELNIKF